MKTHEAARPHGLQANDWRWTWAALALVLGWDAGGLDMPLARLAVVNGSFALRDHWLTTGVLHDGARQLFWAIALWLLAGLWWPTGVLRRISFAGRVQWLASALMALLVVAAFKHVSRTSCPWDMSEFGGVASYVSHWAWPADRGPGHCFPAGHASAGFALVGGYFVLRETAPRHALGCLAASIGAGLVLGLAQQLRGAHFMSHTLWTGWICWFAAFALHALAQGRRRPVHRILASHDSR